MHIIIILTENVSGCFLSEHSVCETCTKTTKPMNVKI